MEIANSVALVTGAGSGIGRATALRLASQGARVICIDIDAAAAAKTAAACGDATLAYTVDVADGEAMQLLADRIHCEHGTLDILVNNAGVGMTGRLDEMSLDDWRWIRSINLDGVVHGCHAFGPAMLAQGKGHIVNLSSGLGYTPRATEPAYVATKAAVLALSRSLRADWGPRGVGVTAICPGIINTPIIESTAYIGSQAANKDSGRKLFSRGHSPDKVARAIVKAIRRDHAVVPVGIESWGGWFLSRFGPMRIQNLVARQDLASIAPVKQQRSPLEGRPFTVTTDDGAELSGVIAGDGPRVVLTHCWTGTRDVWSGVAQHLVGRGLQVIAYDHRGHGASTAGSEAPSLERLAKDLRDVLESTGASDAVLAGHSIGGMTIQRLAIDDPDAIEKHARAIVLVATSARGVVSTRLARPIERLVASSVAQRVMSSRSGNGFARRAYGRRPEKAHVVTTREMFAATHPMQRRGLLSSMHAMDLRALDRIDVPVTVVVGSKDRLTHPKLGREIAQRLEAKLVELADAGHMIPMEAPAAVADAIAEHT